MNCSLARRDATPASAKNFCRRTMKASGHETWNEEDERVATSGSLSSPASLRFGLGLAQSSHAVASFPLAAFLQQFHALIALHDVTFCAGRAGCAQAAML